MENRITKEMTIGEILQIHPGMAKVLTSGGMYCVTCPSARGETLEEAAYVQGIDPELLEVRLNTFLDAMR